MVCPGARTLLILRTLGLAVGLAGGLAAQDSAEPGDAAPESVLFEPLPAVRGFYMTYDRAYEYAGVTGFSLPGDYTTRLLVMINGHYMTDNVYSSDGFFGQDFDLDMDLVKRIEIVRGATSALYGSNGVLATINIVTKSPVEAKTLRASSETGSFGEKKVQLSSGLELGGGANLLVSASAFNNAGRSLYFPGLGWAENADGERGDHAFASLVWRNWTFTGLLGSRFKQVPTGWFGTIPGDPGDHIVDSRGFFEAAYARDLSAVCKFRWRVYYDQYRYRARYDYARDGGILGNRDLTNGDWVGSQLAYDFAIPHVGILTVGGEVNAYIRALQENYDVFPQAISILNVDHPDVSYGAFAQQQWQMSAGWTGYFGLRFDDSRLHPAFVSPRAALVYRASPRTTYKLLYGRAFRNPNAYESYYNDGMTEIGNPSLRPERAQTYEADVEHKFGERWKGLLNGYYYQLNDLIEAVTIPAGFLQYQNAQHGRAEGASAELSGRPAEWIETTASVALQHDELADQPWLANSPSCIAKWRAAAPVAHHKLWSAAAMQYLSTRRTIDGEIVPSVWLTDLTFTTRNLTRILISSSACGIC